MVHHETAGDSLSIVDIASEASVINQLSAAANVIRLACAMLRNVFKIHKAVRKAILERLSLQIVTSTAVAPSVLLLVCHRCSSHMHASSALTYLYSAF